MDKDNDIPTLVIDTDEFIDMDYDFHQFNCVFEHQRWYIEKWQYDEYIKNKYNKKDLT